MTAYYFQLHYGLQSSNNSNDWAELTIKNGIIDPKPCN